MNRAFHCAWAALAAGSLAATIWAVGCSSVPREIDPMYRPGDLRTPRYVFVEPNLTPSLPAGFHPCGQFTAPVTFNDGSVYTLSGCLYCPDDPSDTTAYVQMNCKGNYYKVVVGSQQVAVAPVSVPVSSPGGTMSAAGTGLKFTANTSFSMNGAMTAHGDNVTINGTTVTAWVQAGVTSFGAGAAVTVKGDNAPVADVLFWGFGVGGIDATTDSNDSLKLEIGFDPDLGVVVLPILNGVPQIDDVQILPWRQL